MNNPGNIIRVLGIRVQDKDAIFNYELTSDRVQLVPGQNQTVVITPKPKKWWRRTWRGQEQEIDFGVHLFEPPLETETAGTLHLPEAASGKILWQSRPAWIPRFLKFLVIFLLLAGAAWLAHWLLRELVVKPSQEPKVLEFSTTEESYQAGSGNPIRLDWKISNFQSDARAIVTYYASDGSVLLDQSYPLQTLKDEQETCEIGVYQPNVILRLIRNLYLQKPEIDTISCIGIAPQPTGENAAFRAGEYQVKLEVLPNSQSSEADNSRSQSFDSERLTNIKLNPTPPVPPLPLPEILYFYSKTPIYRQAGSTDTATTGAGALPQYPNTPIQMNWVVNNIREIAAIELNSVHIAANGAIENKQIRYPVQNGIPAGLAGQCRSQGTRLLCENVPTQAAAPGKYTFTLNVVMSPERGSNRITKDSESIEVRPPLPSIQAFTVNGTDVMQNPQLVQLINPARGPVNLNLSWEVADRDRVKVELLPAPGMVDSSSPGLSYALSPTPGSTTLTLQVTNQAGEVVSRSVVIQTAAFPSPPAPAPVPPAAQSNPNAAPGSPPSAPGSAAPGTSIELDQPPPYELPPRAN
ncbi:MAG: hypothetical protein HC895_19805 [Leptolyngbyaceae cyanobacterium SM1_3_5]|nr:hypothetical protein [Leptolyngbyaceae cyanobacterium SM1_3_5]